MGVKATAASRKAVSETRSPARAGIEGHEMKKSVDARPPHERTTLIRKKDQARIADINLSRARADKALFGFPKPLVQSERAVLLSLAAQMVRTKSQFLPNACLDVCTDPSFLVLRSCCRM
jgi:hypothetical protein